MIYILIWFVLTFVIFLISIKHNSTVQHGYLKIRAEPYMISAGIALMLCGLS